MKTRAIAITSLLLLAAGCEDHTEGVEEAVVGEAEQTPARDTDESAESAATELAIDAARSSVGFTGAKVTDSHDGTFETWSGTIAFDPENVTASSVDISIQMDSVQIEPERLLNHLKSDDFFDIETYPTATFTSTRVVEEPGAGGTTHRITGNLTLRGESKSITFPAKVEVSDGEVAASAEFVIQRADFGIVYEGMADDLIEDEVVIRFDVHAPRT
jgi:polyisoprenoid-binding protein YceI